MLSLFLPLSLSVFLSACLFVCCLSVCLCLSVSVSLSHTTHTRTHAHIQYVFITIVLSFTHSSHSLIYPFTYSLIRIPPVTYSLTHSLSPSLPHSDTHSFILFTHSFHSLQSQSLIYSVYSYIVFTPITVTTYSPTRSYSPADSLIHSLTHPLSFTQSSPHFQSFTD